MLSEAEMLAEAEALAETEVESDEARVVLFRYPVKVEVEKLDGEMEAEVEVALAVGVVEQGDVVVMVFRIVEAMVVPFCDTALVTVALL